VNKFNSAKNTVFTGISKYQSAETLVFSTLYTH